MRYGFTTGSCAAAAAKAAAYMLLTGKEKRSITIETPKGILFPAEITQIVREEKRVRCAVIKDGGDDPDVTTGAHVVATVSYYEKAAMKSRRTHDEEHGCNDEEDGREENGDGIFLCGGVGVGMVTKPGLKVPVGKAAINPVPEQMIRSEVKKICALCDYQGSLRVEISVPEGVELSGKTFNPRLGIEGGISILGTTGIVEPMSEKALLDTIYVELKQKKALGYRIVAVSPGNYGLDFMKQTFDYDLDKSVKCSNFIGDTIDMAAELGFEGMLLTGHIGKLVKVSGGMMNTHSKEGDCRMELLCALGIKNGLPISGAKRILDSVTTEEGVRIFKEEGILAATMKEMMEKIHFYLNRRSAGKLSIECMVYANEYGLLGKTEGAEVFLNRCRNLK